MTEPVRLDSKVRLVWMAGAFIPVVLLILVTIGLVVGRVPVAPWATGGFAAVIAIPAVALTGARWRSWSYRLTDTELIVRFGVLVKVERWMPRTRVQHVDLVGGPIERSLGLRQLVIYTAGTREADVTIPGLPTLAAEGLRSELLSWSKSSQPAEALEIFVETPGAQAELGELSDIARSWEQDVDDDDDGSIAGRISW